MLTITDATILAAARAILEKQGVDVQALGTPLAIRASVRYEVAREALVDALVAAECYADDHNAQVSLDLHLQGRSPYADRATE